MAGTNQSKKIKNYRLYCEDYEKEIKKLASLRFANIEEKYSNLSKNILTPKNNGIKQDLKQSTCRKNKLLNCMLESISSINYDSINSDEQKKTSDYFSMNNSMSSPESLASVGVGSILLAEEIDVDDCIPVCDIEKWSEYDKKIKGKRKSREFEKENLPNLRSKAKLKKLKTSEIQPMRRSSRLQQKEKNQVKNVVTIAEELNINVINIVSTADELSKVNVDTRQKIRKKNLLITNDLESEEEQLQSVKNSSDKNKSVLQDEFNNSIYAPEQIHNTDVILPVKELRPFIEANQSINKNESVFQDELNNSIPEQIHNTDVILPVTEVRPFIEGNQSINKNRNSSDKNESVLQDELNSSIYAPEQIHNTDVILPVTEFRPSIEGSQSINKNGNVEQLSRRSNKRCFPPTKRSSKKKNVVPEGTSRFIKEISDKVDPSSRYLKLMRDWSCNISSNKVRVKDVIYILPLKINEERCKKCISNDEPVSFIESFSTPSTSPLRSISPNIQDFCNIDRHSNVKNFSRGIDSFSLLTPNSSDEEDRVCSIPQSNSLKRMDVSSTVNMPDSFVLNGTLVNNNVRLNSSGNDQLNFSTICPILPTIIEEECEVTILENLANAELLSPNRSKITRNCLTEEVEHEMENSSIIDRGLRVKVAEKTTIAHRNSDDLQKNKSTLLPISTPLEKVIHNKLKFTQSLSLNLQSASPLKSINLKSKSPLKSITKVNLKSKSPLKNITKVNLKSKSPLKIITKVNQKPASSLNIISMGSPRPISPLRSTTNVNLISKSSLKNTTRVTSTLSPKSITNVNQKSTSPLNTITDVNQKSISPLKTITRVNLKPVSSLKSMANMNLNHASSRNSSTKENQKSTSPLKTITKVNLKPFSSQKTITKVNLKPASSLKTIANVNLNHESSRNSSTKENQKSTSPLKIITMKNQNSTSPLKNITNENLMPSSTIKTIANVNIEPSSFVKVTTNMNLKSTAPMKTVIKVNLNPTSLHKSKTNINLKPASSLKNIPNSKFARSSTLHEYMLSKSKVEKLSNNLSKKSLLSNSDRDQCSFHDRNKNKFSMSNAFINQFATTPLHQTDKKLLPTMQSNSTINTTSLSYTFVETDKSTSSTSSMWDSSFSLFKKTVGQVKESIQKDEPRTNGTRVKNVISISDPNHSSISLMKHRKGNDALNYLSIRSRTFSKSSLRRTASASGLVPSLWLKSMMSSKTSESS